MIDPLDFYWHHLLIATEKKKNTDQAHKHVQFMLSLKTRTLLWPHEKTRECS